MILFFRTLLAVALAVTVVNLFSLTTAALEGRWLLVVGAAVVMAGCLAFVMELRLYLWRLVATL